MIILLSSNVAIASSNFNFYNSKGEAKERIFKHSDDKSIYSLNVIKDHSDVESDFDYISIDIPEIVYIPFYDQVKKSIVPLSKKIFTDKVPLWILNLKILI